MAENVRAEKLVIRNADILFRNFSGAADKYNHAGDRNFCVIINEPELVEKLRSEGWRLKPLRPRDPDDPIRFYLKVNVSYRFKAPIIYIVENNVKTALTEETVSILDNLDITNVDVAVQPSRWERPDGEWGISAYLKTLYVTVETDEFAMEYGTPTISENAHPSEDDDDLPF